MPDVKKLIRDLAAKAVKLQTPKPETLQRMEKTAVASSEAGKKVERPRV